MGAINPALDISEDFIARYNTAGPRYTSYPPATRFHENFSETDFHKSVELSNRFGTRNLSLYFHIPFCATLCSYCGCTMEIKTPREIVREYLDQLLIEIDRVIPSVDLSRKVTMIHFGGGTPNFLKSSELLRILDHVRSRFTLTADAEIAMECDPSLLKPGHLEEWASAGFNRLSFGIQDFSEDVLKLINRRPSTIAADELVSLARSLGYKGINLDFIYGLPGQTEDSFHRTIEKAIASRPDRLVTFSYAHVPWAKEHQKKLESLHLPEASEKIRILISNIRQLTAAGYEFIGMDHFALSGDELASAAENRTLHRNFQGYCTKAATGQVLGFGASAITQLEGAYVQNHKSSRAYIDAMKKGGLAIERGYLMTEEDRFRRLVINELMCNARLHVPSIAEEIGITVSDAHSRLAPAMNNLSDFEKDSLVVRTADGLEVSTRGRMVVRNIAMIFDPIFQSESKSSSRYSKTV